MKASIIHTDQGYYMNDFNETFGISRPAPFIIEPEEMDTAIWADGTRAGGPGRSLRPDEIAKYARQNGLQVSKKRGPQPG